MEPKCSKEELKVWARCFEHAVPEAVSFSLDGGEFITAQQLADRVRPLDAQLADRVLAWHSATTSLGKYVREKLERHPYFGTLNLHLAKSPEKL